MSARLFIGHLRLACLSKFSALEWKANGDGYKFSETRWLKVGDRLGDVTGNPSYDNYVVKRIWKSLRDSQWRIEFQNGVELIEKLLKPLAAKTTATVSSMIQPIALVVLPIARP